MNTYNFILDIVQEIEKHDIKVIRNKDEITFIITRQLQYDRIMLSKEYLLSKDINIDETGFKQQITWNIPETTTKEELNIQQYKKYIYENIDS